jgi:hypothetical protein
MNNRNYLKIIFLVSILILSSCTNQLDEELELSTTSENIDYSSQAGAFNAFIGSYQKFQDMGWEQIPLLSLRGDDVNAGGLGDQAGFSDTDRFVYDNNYWMYNQLWDSWFQKILQITTQIEQLEKFRKGGVDSAKIDQYIAECKTLRAFLTLQLSRTFGAVFNVESANQTKLVVRSKDETMQWVSSQIDEATPFLLDMRPNERTDLKGGVTKYTALAIKAMAKLELKDYQAVADATGMIIKSGKFDLYSSYYSLFKTPGKLANENLLEIQYSDLGVASGGGSINHLFAFYGPQDWTPAVSGASNGWGFYEPSLKYIKFMLNRGEKERLETSVLFTNRGIDQIKADPLYVTLPSWITNTTRDGDLIKDYSRALFASGKHYLPSKQLTPGRTDYGSNKNYIVTRYSEVLLMYAEALTRGATGSAGSAADAVTLVRQRAGLGAVSSVTSQQVMDEKYAELGMEWGIRYFDMVRLEQTAELSYDGRTYTAAKKYLPYPLAQLDKSYVLKEYVQNHPNP